MNLAQKKPWDEKKKDFFLYIWGGELCNSNTLICMVSIQMIYLRPFLGSFQLIIVVENNVSNQNME